jgi:hypothetical protein
LLKLHKGPRADEQFVGDAPSAGLYLSVQFGNGLFTGLAALLQPFYFCLVLGDSPDMLVKLESYVPYPATVPPND